MKINNKVFIAITVLFFMFIALVACGDVSDQQSDDGFCVTAEHDTGVYTVNASAVTEEGEVYFTDETGNIWVFELADGEPAVNQHVVLVLWDNETPFLITDDVILEWR